MFKCAITHRVSRPGEACNKIVVETRNRTYTKWVLNEETRQMVEVECSTGSETVKEVNVNQEGLKLWNSLSAEEKMAMFPPSKQVKYVNTFRS